jgi:hypothetical protein
VAADETLREELLGMLLAHRQAVELERRDPSSVARRRDVDRDLADRFWEILDDYEVWPGRALVGEDGAEAAWIIVQEEIEDPELQHRAVEALEVAVARGDADPVHLAMLVDRVRMSDGREQLYGSQFVVGPSDTLVPWPIDDVAAVDRRRQRLGLPPLAEHAAAMRQRWRAQPSGEPRHDTPHHDSAHRDV